MNASRWLRTVISIRHSDRAPSPKARTMETPVRGASGVNSRIGMVPSTSSTADIGPTIRSGSCSSGSRPNSGAVGMKPQSTLPGSTKAQAEKASSTKAKALPSASARLEALCAPPMPAARTSKELCSTSV